MARPYLFPRTYCVRLVSGTRHAHKLCEGHLITLVFGSNDASRLSSNAILGIVAQGFLDLGARSGSSGLVPVLFASCWIDCRREHHPVYIVLTARTVALLIMDPLVFVY